MVTLDIAQVKESVRIEDVVSRYVAITPKASIYVGHCPFHHDSGRPNLVVFPKTQTWACFACGAQGDVLDFICRIGGLTVHEALVRMDNDTPPQRTARPPGRRAAAPASASQAARHRAYEALMAAERLLPQHSAMLRQRGFSGDAIRRLGYRSHQGGEAPQGTFSGIPGFFVRQGRWHVVGPEGLLIPVRNAEGLIIGCQVRASNPRSGKYRWLSSACLPHGTSSGSPCHVAHKGGQVVWVTEGPLKADLSAELLGETVLGVAGVTTWKHALPIIDQLEPREVILAFDRDERTQASEAVERSTRDMIQALSRREIDVSVASWRGAKGLDDALVAGVPVRATRHAILSTRIHLNGGMRRGHRSKPQALDRR